MADDKHDPAAQRSRLQEIWRKRLTAAEQIYREAAAALEQAERAGLTQADPAVAAARERKAAARAEYLSTLRKFTNLVLRGKSPEENG